MLITLLLGIAAAIAAAHFEPRIKRLLDSAAMADLPLNDQERRMISFALCLLAAAILSGMLGNGSAVTLSFGALIGVFGPRVIGQYQARRDSR